MPTAKKTKKKAIRAYPWRIQKNKWTDTLFEKRLLENPSLMTHHELASALEEYQEWRSGNGKYFWKEDPIKEEAEIEVPFSSHIVTNLLWETITRLRIGGDLSLGRFRGNA